MPTVLATIDGSKESRQIIPTVIKLAKDMNARVRLLTVVPPVRGTPPSKPRIPKILSQNWGPGVAPYTHVYVGADEPEWVESREQAIDRAIANGQDLLAEAARPLHEAGIEVQLCVVIDPEPAEAIIAFAKEDSIDLIAMATHGRSGLNQLVQGSVASAVVRSGVAPTVLVRPSP
jgi:nucleotide-binding universal stress UspA family protein